MARDRDYSTLNFKDEPEEFFAAVRDTLAALFARHTKAELYQAALDQLLLLAPLYTVADIRADEQLAFREYFVDVDQGERGPVAWAGPWAHLSATPLTTTRRAPHVGEHDADVAARPARAGAPRRSRSSRTARPRRSTVCTCSTCPGWASAR